MNPSSRPTSVTRLIAAIALSGVSLLLLAGCVETTELGGSTSDNYVSGDGTVSEFPPKNRQEPVRFTSISDTGEEISAEDFRGQILVVNFWYAACPPCRVEAPWLQELNEQFADADVQFLGVNVRDSAETSRAFAESFGITYPSLLDATTKDVTSAFTGLASPAAVPTTVVLDREGRPASRIVGLIEKSTLESLIESALGEAQSD
jgi:peroxiredoxin